MWNDIFLPLCLNWVFWYLKRWYRPTTISGMSIRYLPWDDFHEILAP
jgi:hypothetical protein